MKIGYAPISTDCQDESLATQSEALTAAGCEKIFPDTISGPKSARPGLEAALERMGDGDVLVVTRLEQLGRTALDTLWTIDELSKRGVPVFLLDLQLDTRTKEGELMVRIMSSLAEWERDLLTRRTKKGMARARAAGRVPGPKPKLCDEQVEVARASIDAGHSVASVARSLGVSRPTLYRALARSLEDIGGT